MFRELSGQDFNAKGVVQGLAQCRAQGRVQDSSFQVLGLWHAKVYRDVLVCHGCHENLRAQRAHNLRTAMSA